VNTGERRGAADAMWERLTGGAGRQQGPGGQRWSERESERAEQCGDGALTGGPGRIVPASFVLNRFKNIQMVQIKFEFLQTLVGSKDTFTCLKNFK
jgi:hypothetical protein